MRAVSLPGADSGAATIIIARDSGFAGHGLRLDLWVNGVSVGSLMAGETVRVVAPHGRATVMVQRAMWTTWQNAQFIPAEARGNEQKAAALPVFKPTTMDLVLKPDETAVLRAGFGSDGADFSMWRAVD